ncbi:hypothetical protein GCM10008932_15230 [Alkalibacterium iburiense]|uniref:DUF624 domain-containing protein n=2 Tax=Alkalibacterium iburiense TaxID=290589 RepID=A0ABN0XHA7_9LACT
MWVVVFQLFLIEDTASLYILVPILTLLLPFVFFPPTQALFATMREIIIQDDWIHVKVFFTFYTSSFKNSLIAGILFTGLAISLSYSIYLSWQLNLILMIVLAVILFYLFLFGLYFFFMESHFDMNLGWKLKQALVFVMGHPVSSIGNFLLFVFIHFVVWSVSPVISFLIGMALTSYFSIYLFMRKMNKLVERKTETAK